MSLYMQLLQGTLFKKYKKDAGYDLLQNEESCVVLQPNDIRMIKTGVKIQIPEGYYGQIAIRSSFGIKGIIHLAGIIDSGYEGEIKVIVCNLSKELVQIHHNERFAQLILIKIFQGEEKQLNDSQLIIKENIENIQEQRKDGGFGSTGQKI